MTDHEKRKGARPSRAAIQGRDPADRSGAGPPRFARVPQKKEFWDSLARLYDETLALRGETIELRKVAEAHQRVVENRQFAVAGREKRLDAWTC